VAPIAVRATSERGKKKEGGGNHKTRGEMEQRGAKGNDLKGKLEKEIS